MSDRRAATPAQLFPKSARVISGFRAPLFDAANRAGVTPNGFCITAAAEKLERGGAAPLGVFQVDDFEMYGMRPAVTSEVM